ncbi:hypothetical protein DPMN_153662 [Dreissena polymorpha]|uniref:Uncharacterized protein n=1 Tax=Dreissena polymorpha TaxID=45954 RepID=A0A9D4FKJ5_DREPO|nr:hypothetical protein DPMN_153662 [Dreissena polymorpha]
MVVHCEINFPITQRLTPQFVKAKSPCSTVNRGEICMWAGRPRVQYQFEVNRCRKEEIRLVMGPCIFEIDHIVIREVRYQFEDNCRNEEIIFQGSSANSVGGDSGQDGQTDRQRR